MDVNAVAEYLKQNPQFFEDYADMIAEIFVPHPHGGHAIPIAERQIVTLREKNHELESKLRELIRFSSENEATGEKLHRSTLALFAAPDLETTLAVIYHSLKEDFGVPEVASRLWGKVPEGSYLPELAATSPEVREYASQLGSPYYGPSPPFESREWFDDGGALLSIAAIPLRTTTTFGFLMLGSPDPHRFHAGMGTMFLTRFAELARFLATLHGGGLSGRSLARMLSAWRTFFRFLIERDPMVREDPTGGLKAPKSPKRLPSALTPDEAVRLVSIDGDDELALRDRALFELAYSSGLRLSELAGLDVDSVDLTTGEVRVFGKGAKERIVPVGVPARAAIETWLAARA